MTEKDKSMSEEMSGAIDNDGEGFGYEPMESESDEDFCPECGCELYWEVIDDKLYQISGGRDWREFMVTCSQCNYRERRMG